MKTILTYFFLSIFSLASYSQDSLIFFLEMAAKNNPVILQRYSEYQAALQKVPQVGSLPDPELSMGVFLSPMELIAGQQVADIKIMQMFPWFGVLKNAKDEMSLMAKTKYEVFRDAKLQVFLDVQRTWYELLKNRENIRISEDNIELLKTLERLAIVKFKAGSISNNSSGSTATNITTSQNQSASSSGMKTMGGSSGSTQAQPSPSMQSTSMGSSNGGSGLIDLYKIQMEIGELENNIALLKNQQNTIIARFNGYINRSPKATVSLPDNLIPDTLNISVLAVSDSMLANSPMLGMLKYEQQSYDARKKMVTRMGFPMVGIGLNYSVINKSPMSNSKMNGDDMIMPMITVTLPIYRKKYKAMQAEADLMKTSASQGYQATANSLQTEYYEAIQLYEDAHRRMKLYDNQCLLAQKSLEITIKSFSVSDAGLNEVLRIRQQKLEYDLKKIEAITDYNTSIAWLNRLMATSAVQ